MQETAMDPSPNPASAAPPTRPKRWLLRKRTWAVAAGLVAVMTGAVAVAVAPEYDEVWPEPGPPYDPFYYVDYEKSPAYHRREANRAAWPWGIGLAAGLPAGLVCYGACRRWSSARPTPSSTSRASGP